MGVHHCLPPCPLQLFELDPFGPIHCKGVTGMSKILTNSLPMPKIQIVARTSAQTNDHICSIQKLLNFTKTYFLLLGMWARFYCLNKYLPLPEPGSWPQYNSSSSGDTWCLLIFQNILWEVGVSSLFYVNIATFDLRQKIYSLH